jgi:hypothetical protein
MRDIAKGISLHLEQEIIDSAMQPSCSREGVKCMMHLIWTEMKHISCHIDSEQSALRNIST